MLRAGTPAQISPAGILFVTTAPAPTTGLDPMATPFRTATLQPNHTKSSISIPCRNTISARGAGGEWQCAVQRPGRLTAGVASQFQLRAEFPASESPSAHIAPNQDVVDTLFEHRNSSLWQHLFLHGRNCHAQEHALKPRSIATGILHEHETVRR